MKCIRSECENQFAPQCRGHICCSQGCWTAILHAEIGISAAGMRPFGMMGDRKKLKAVRLKYERLSRAANAPSDFRTPGDGGGNGTAVREGGG